MSTSIITISGNSFAKNTCKKQVLEYVDKSTETEKHNDEYVNKFENGTILEVCLSENGPSTFITTGQELINMLVARSQRSLYE